MLAGFNAFLLFLVPDSYVVPAHMVGVGDIDLTALEYIGDVRQPLLMNW